jgi:hypothetical protein
MKWRSLGVLAIVLALLGGAYYLLEAKGRRSEVNANQLFRTGENEIEALFIARGEARIALKREGDAWRITEPVQAKADSTETTSLLNAIMSAKSERIINREPTGLGEYGLDRPSITLKLSLKGGTPSPALLFGDKNPSGFYVYAKREDSPSVFLVTDSLRSRLDRKPTDLRDKTLLQMEPDKVRRVELSGKGRSISLSSEGPEHWRLVQPVKAKADDSAVRDLLWRIRNARVTEFLSSGPDAAHRYGLDHPDLMVVVQEEGASKLLLMKKAPDAKVGLYAMAQPGEGVVSTDARLLADLSKSPFDLRDRSLLRFETADVAAIQLRRNGESLALAKQGEAWKLTGPTPGDAHAAKVYDLLYALKELRYRALIGNDGRNLSRYGLASPRAEVELTMTDGSRLPALLLGKTENDRLYAKTAAGSPIYAIEPTFMSRIPRALDDLKQNAGLPAGK